MGQTGGMAGTRVGAGGRVGFRETVGQRLQLALVVTVVCSVQAWVFFAWPGGGFWPGPLIFAGTFTAAALIPRAARTVLTADAVIVRQRGRRRIAWCDVESITRKRRFGGATVILLREVGGRETLLPGLVTGWLAWDPGFDARYDTVTAWWVAGRDGHERRP